MLLLRGECMIYYTSRDYVYIWADRLYRFPPGIVSWNDGWVVNDKFRFKDGVLTDGETIYYEG